MDSNSFQVAVVGCGRWGRNHAKTSRRIFGASLRYLCDIDPANLEKVKDVAGEAKLVDSLDHVLQDPEVNAIILATPVETHYALAKKCLEADKNVLVEKPIALFSNQARELEHLAASKRKVLMVGHLLLYHPAVRKIKQLIQEGVIGKLQYIYSNRLNLGAVRKEENILWSFAPHDISVLQFLIEDDPVEIDAKGAIFLQPGIHDVTLTTLKYPRNIHAHIHVSWLHPFKEHRLVIIGDRSMIVFEDSKDENKLVLYPKGIDWINGEPRKREADFQVIEYESTEPLELELRHFGDCVRENRKPLTDGVNAIKVLEILERAQAQLEGHAAEATKEPAIKAAKTEQKFFVHPTAVVDDACQIAEGTKIWHFSHIQKGTVIGKNCTLGQNVNVGSNVRIGNQVKIQNNVSVYEGVELEDYVFCGPSMVFTNILDPRCEFPQRGSEFYVRTLVKYGASIGANATVVCGVTVGRFSFVGAGAVVTKDVPEYALVVGCPARVVGWMCRCGQRLSFDAEAAECSRCRRAYRKEGDGIVCVCEPVAVSS